MGLFDFNKKKSNEEVSVDMIVNAKEEEKEEVKDEAKQLKVILTLN